LEGDQTNRVILTVFGPSVHARYVTSRQNTRKLPIGTVAWLHNTAVVVSIPIVVFLFVIFARRKEPLYVSLFILILFGLIANAFIVGALSFVYSRLQSRVIWLVVFYATVGSLQILRDSSLSHRPMPEDGETGVPMRTGLWLFFNMQIGTSDMDI
jgi:hypothetical protein